MSSGIMIMMIAVSALLGAIGLIGLLWAVRTGQFDDKSKFIDSVRFDGEEELRDAAELEERRHAFEEKRKQQTAYTPPD